MELREIQLQLKRGPFLNTQNAYRERTSRSGNLALNLNSFVDLCKLRGSFIIFNTRGDLSSRAKNMHQLQSGFPGLRNVEASLTVMALTSQLSLRILWLET